jgi:hypothetical protein
MKTPKPGVFGHRGCIGKEVEAKAKEANRVSQSQLNARYLQALWPVAVAVAAYELWLWLLAMGGGRGAGSYRNGNARVVLPHHPRCEHWLLCCSPVLPAARAACATTGHGAPRPPSALPLRRGALPLRHLQGPPLDRGRC